MNTCSSSESSLGSSITSVVASDGQALSSWPKPEHLAHLGTKSLYFVVHSSVLWPLRLQRQQRPGGVLQLPPPLPPPLLLVPVLPLLIPWDPPVLPLGLLELLWPPTPLLFPPRLLPRPPPRLRPRPRRAPLWPPLSLEKNACWSGRVLRPLLLG